MTNFNLAEHFDTYFSLFIADTPELLQEVFKIRYQVYCEELNYEPKEKFPDRMEQDTFDTRSIHCLLKHKPSGVYMGCVRAVLADSRSSDAIFPFERICHHNIDLSKIPRCQFFEISRLAVISQFRKRKGETNMPAGLLFSEAEVNAAVEEQRRFPLIALSLYLACTTVAMELNLNALTLMEPRLSRHLRRCGIPSHSIGDFLDFHGKRGPFLLQPEEVLQSMNPEIRDLFESIDLQIRDSVLNHPMSKQHRNLLFNRAS